MALPVTIPNEFANATTSIPLSQLDANFTTLSNAINGINSGAEILANLKSSNVTITGGTISNVTLDNVTVQTENFDNVTLSNVTITSGNATFTNVTATQANVTTANVTTAVITNLSSGNVVVTGGTFTGITAANIAGANISSGSAVLANANITTLNVSEIIYPVASFSWNSATASPAAVFQATEGRLINAHRNMRRCLLLDNGTVNYYLDPTDSTKKADGTNSVLTGADGMVMVEIPAFYVRRVVAGTITTWFVADTALPGFVLHPAFTKDGSTVTHRYYSAYDACAFDVSGSTYISGLNRDNAVSNTPNVDATATTGDKLASVSGIYPMVGLTRAQFRTIAANRGSGWRQLDWTLFSAVQVLYLTEYQTFFSQSVLGDGNTNGSYVTQSGDQNDSPNSVAGLTNSIGNASTNGSQASAGAKPGTAFMSYRGIENFYGNVWNWADGIIGNPDGSVSADQMRLWWTNNSADFSDSVKTNMTEIAVNLATGSDYASALAATDYFFVGTSVSGGSSSTYITDRWTGSTSDDRVVRVGGSAGSGALAGAFAVEAADASSFAGRGVGGRLAF